MLIFFFINDCILTLKSGAPIVRKKRSLHFEDDDDDLDKDNQRWMTWSGDKDPNDFLDWSVDSKGNFFMDIPFTDMNENQEDRAMSDENEVVNA